MLCRRAVVVDLLLGTKKRAGLANHVVNWPLYSRICHHGARDDYRGRLLLLKHALGLGERRAELINLGQRVVEVEARSRRGVDA